MKRTLHLALALAAPLMLHAQTSAPDAKKVNDIEQRLNDLTTTLQQTQTALQDSLTEIQRLRLEINALKQPTVATTPAPPVAPASLPEKVEAIKEQQEILAAEIKQHEQTKVETVSKYPLRVTGLALFNAYSNAGVVDNTDLPTYALARFPGASHGSAGATLRQTILGVEADGPRFGSAHTSAFVNLDFFGGGSSNAYGYTSQAGYVRMRTAALALDWTNTTLQLGYVEPLISPRSPTSYATVAQPALSGSGNLWVWAPQLRAEHRISIGNRHTFALEGGFIFPYSPNYSNLQLDSPVSADRRPGFEGRLSYRADRSLSASEHTLNIGISGYSASQFYSGGIHLRSWAATSDFFVPISRWVELSGELYRGFALGGFGAGGYRDALFGKNPITGVSITRGIDTAGGWTQLKLLPSSRIQANIMYGMDDTFSSNFLSLTLPTSTNPLSTVARNQTFSGNLIFRPLHSLILSPEYRHVETWNNTGTPNVANIFTLSAGYQF